MYHNFFINSSLNGHLGDFHAVAIVNIAAMNIEVHVVFLLWFSQGICLIVELLSHIVAQMVNNLPAMQETHVRFLGWEDPLEKGTATHFFIVAWRIPWTEQPDRL